MRRRARTAGTPASATRSAGKPTPSSTLRSVRRRAVRIAAALSAIVACAACGGPAGAPVRTVDLLKGLDHAETRPLARSFRLDEHTFGGQARASVAVPVPSRITWQTNVPRRATLRADVAVPSSEKAAVKFRVGISDDRVFESLLERTVTSEESANGWTPIVVDLSAYAGLKLSLFYQPERRSWRVVLATDPVSGAPSEVYWGEPRLDTDTAAARRFRQERASAR